MLTVHLSTFHLPGQSILLHFKQVWGARWRLVLGSASWSLWSVSWCSHFLELSALLCDPEVVAALMSFDGSTYLNIVVVVWLLCKHSKLLISQLVGKSQPLLCDSWWASLICCSSVMWSAMGTLGTLGTNAKLGLMSLQKRSYAARCCSIEFFSFRTFFHVL